MIRTTHVLAQSIVLGLLFVCTVSVAFAQEQESDVRARIYAQIVSDPASSELSEAEIDALVDALAEQSQRAQEATIVAASPETQSDTFGAEAANMQQGISQGVLGGTLGAVILALVLLGGAVWVHHRHAVAKGKEQESSSPPPSQEPPQM